MSSVIHGCSLVSLAATSESIGGSSARGAHHQMLISSARLRMLNFMRWFFGRSRMVHRTCLDCGETWTLEASLAHLGSRGSRATGTRRALRTTIRGASNDFIADTYAELDQVNEAIRETRTCPKCGGNHYKDRRVRTEIG